MPTPKDEEIKIRVPRPMKKALVRLADHRLTTLSEVTRDALIEYVERHGYDRKAIQRAGKAPHP